ncbi:MAG TPA: IPT/TIG domain-containing protein, partial [Thermoanaerobaculia bacterium]
TLANPNVATVTIEDDEAPPTVTMAEVRKNEGDAGTTPYTFTVTLSTASEAPFTFNYDTLNVSSASSGSDYTPASGSLTFGPGQVEKTFSIGVVGDALYEEDEFFMVWLRRDGFVVAQAAGWIYNDDPYPTITVADVIVHETNGRSVAVVTFNASQPTNTYIEYSAQPRTASADSDFQMRRGSFAFNGEMLKTIEIPIYGDTIPEDTEEFVLRLYEWDAMVNDDEVVITIMDDDVGVGPDKLLIPSGERRRGLIQVGGPVESDTVFTLTSSAPGVVEVPSTAIIPAGESRVTFEVRAHAAGAREEVVVTFPASLSGGSATIQVWTYTEADLTLTPTELTLYAGQTVTVTAAMTPAGEALAIPLSADGNVEVAERLHLDATGRGSFTVTALKNGRFIVTATLPVAYGSEATRVFGTVAEPPTLPVLSSISPNQDSTAGGTPVEVRGALFRIDCTLQFGGVPATMLQFVDASTLHAIAPPHAAGTVDVTLTCGGDVASLPHAFTYRGAGPHVSSVAPSTGHMSGGTYVRISGTDFSSSCWPYFDGVASPAALVRDTNTITAVVPPHAAGTVDVRLLCTGTDALLEQGFSFTTAADAASQIANVEPMVAAPGDLVTIRGTGFRPRDLVTLVGRAATVLDSTPESHTFVVPDLPPGLVDVT